MISVPMSAVLGDISVTRISPEKPGARSGCLVLARQHHWFANRPDDVRSWRSDH